MIEDELVIDDRIVHAKYNGVEVVRLYDEWFLEPTPFLYDAPYVGATPKKRESPIGTEPKKVSVEEAANAAAAGIREAWLPRKKIWPAGFQIFFDQEGGEVFDEIVKSIHPEFYIEIQYINEDGHQFIAMLCPGCREIVQINEAQLGGKTCTSHSELGCGFHGYVIGQYSGYICRLGKNLAERWRESDGY